MTAFSNTTVSNLNTCKNILAERKRFSAWPWFKRRMQLHTIQWPFFRSYKNASKFLNCLVLAISVTTSKTKPVTPFTVSFPTLSLIPQHFPGYPHALRICDQDFTRSHTCLERSSYMIRACRPLSRKNSPIAHPEYGARYCSGAASDAVALTTIVYFMASASVNRFTIWATVDRFWPIAT